VVKDRDSPGWLPDLVECDWNDIEGTVDRAYAVFFRAFLNESSRPRFRGKRMGIKRHPEYDGKSATFWHLITEGAKEVSRAPVRERIERIAWARALIVEAGKDSTRVKIWMNERQRHGHRKSVRWLIGLLDFSYVVVLDDRQDFVLLWTAYPIRENHQRRKLEREYDAWIAAHKS